MKPLLFDLGGCSAMLERLHACVDFEQGAIDRREFPDGETYLRLLTPVSGREVALVCTLDRPNGKTLPLLFAAAAARDQGASRIGLIAPYLAYMRQDRAFSPGEAVTSISFARIISASFDWLLTVDPHLHRNRSLAALYGVQAIAVSAAGPVADWIAAEIERPVLIGPDEESSQWVARIAERARAPWGVLRKHRSGDLEVSLSGAPPDVSGRTPVIIDDIVSSGRTMAEAVRLVRGRGAAPICIAVHALFAGDALDILRASGPARIVTTDTVAHETNAISIACAVGEALKTLLEPAGAGAGSSATMACKTDLGAPGDRLRL